MKKQIEQGALLHHDGKLQMRWRKNSASYICYGLLFHSVQYCQVYCLDTSLNHAVVEMKNRHCCKTVIKYNVIWPGTISCLEFYGTSHLISGGEDGLMCVWRTKKWECLKTIKAHKYVLNLNQYIMLLLRLWPVIILTFNYFVSQIAWSKKVRKGCEHIKCFAKPKMMSSNAFCSHAKVISLRSFNIKKKTKSAYTVVTFFKKWLIQLFSFCSPNCHFCSSCNICLITS